MFAGNSSLSLIIHSYHETFIMRRNVKILVGRRRWRRASINLTLRRSLVLAGYCDPGVVWCANVLMIAWHYYHGIDRRKVDYFACVSCHFDAKGCSLTLIWLAHSTLYIRGDEISWPGTLPVANDLESVIVAIRKKCSPNLTGAA